VALVGRQRGQLGLHVLAGSIPAEQSHHGEPVTQVVQPRRARCVRADAGFGDDATECLADDLVDQPAAGSGNEQAGLPAPPPPGGTDREVVLDRGHRARKNGNQPGLAELRLADEQHRVRVVDVVEVEVDRFPDSQTGRGE
jgi:hypothetical protein